MKCRVWAGLLALLLLAGCGGGTSQAPATAAPVTGVAAAPEATMAPTTMAAAPTEAPTASAMAEPTIEATMVVMDTTATTKATGAMTSATAEATTGALDGTAAPAANGGNSDARQAILNAQRAQLTGGAFRSETRVETGGQTYTIQGEFVPPERMHVTSSIAGQNTEMIIVKDKMWTKNGDQWTEVPGGGAKFSQMMSQLVANPDANGIEINNARSLGTEDVAGVTAAVYTFDSVYGTGDQAVSSTSKMWVSTANGLPVKLEGDGEAGGVKTKTTQVITYDPSTTIEAP